MSLVNLARSDYNDEQRALKHGPMMVAAIPPKSNAAECGRKQGFAFFLDSSDNESVGPVVRKKRKRVVVNDDDEDEDLLSFKPKPLTTIIPLYQRVAGVSVANANDDLLSSTTSALTTTLHPFNWALRCDQVIRCNQVICHDQVIRHNLCAAQLCRPIANCY